MKRHRTINKYNATRIVDISESKKKTDKYIIKSMIFTDIVNKMTNGGYNNTK